MPRSVTQESVLSEVFIMAEVCGVNQVLGVVGPQQALQGGEVTVILVFYVDTAPGVFSPPVHLSCALVCDRDVGSNNCEGHPLSHPVVLRVHLGHGEVVDLDLVLLQLEQDLKCE